VGESLKYVGRVHVEAGTVELAIESVKPTQTLALCTGIQNVVVVYSNRYGTDEWGGPLVLQVHPKTILTLCISLSRYVCM